MEVGGQQVLVLWALGGSTRPYKAKISLGKDHKEYAYFIRKGASTIRAKGADETDLMSLAATVPHDDRINQQARLEDLSPALMQEYLQKVGSDLAKQAHELSLVELGRQMGVTGGPVEAVFPLNVGLMMFNPEPWRFFPAMQIDVVWFPKEGPGGNKFSEKIFKGPIPRMLGDALDYIKRNLITETVIKQRGRAEADRVENFPYAAIEEAVVNAVYHRGYDTREPIEVRIEPGELFVISYPGPDRSVRLDQLRAGRARPRRYRNRRIGEFLKELEFTEGRATGVPKIIDAMRNNGSPAPEFEFDEDHSYFMVRLPVHPAALVVASSPAKDAPTHGRPESRPESRSESRPESPQMWRARPEWRPAWGTGSTHHRIMAAIVHAPLSRAEIARALGHKSVTGAARQALIDLLEAHLVEYTVPDKPNSRLQKYRISMDGES